MTTMGRIWRRSIPTCSDNVCKSVFERSTVFYITKPLLPIRHERTEGVRECVLEQWISISDFHMSKVRLACERRGLPGKLRNFLAGI